MLDKITSKTRGIVRQIRQGLNRGPDLVQAFHSNHYLRHNARRLEHLASLRIPVAGMSVLEVGAGIGDHSHYYIDRGCDVTITEARPENLLYLRKRYRECRVEFLDMESPTAVEGAPFDVVHCYGLLYHLSTPRQALEFLSRNTRRMLFLETCVSPGDDDQAHETQEERSSPTQAFSGTGCRPARGWLFRELQTLFRYVYLPRTQPCHEEFPLDWSVLSAQPAGLMRAVFIASREPLDSDSLIPSLVEQQFRQD